MRNREATRAAQANRLANQHRDLKAEVAALTNRKSLSPAEHFRMVELKKKKLAKKDAMAKMGT